MKTALIFGVSGQDGSYLAEFLISKGYRIIGIIRHNSSNEIPSRLKSIISNNKKQLILKYGDITDTSFIYNIINENKIDEIYNLAAQSHVGLSFEIPLYTMEVDAKGTLNILEAIRYSKKDIKYYQASTSELFGGLPNSNFQNENTMFYPKSPSATAKLYAYWITVNYRESYNIFACNGILFNHESPRRGKNFVTRKITKGIAEILNGKKEKISLGNIYSLRDWGYSKDYVEGMWLMLQQETPDDYVLATSECHTIKEFIEIAFSYVGISIQWQGKGLDEKGYDKETKRLLIDINPDLFRPNEVMRLCGDYSKAKQNLGWEPTTKFKQLVYLMLESDLKNEMGVTIGEYNKNGKKF